MEMKIRLLNFNIKIMFKNTGFKSHEVINK